jgi:hypothetical protein
MILFISSTNWLYYPRLAYQNDRRGLGIFWSFYMTFSGLTCLFFYLKSNRVLFPIFLLMIFAYFSGSKSFLIFGPLKIILLDRVITNKKINFKLIFLGILFLCFTSYLIIIYNFKLDEFSIESIQQVSENYFTETANSNLVFSDYINDNLKYTNGEMYASNIWKYLPRFLFPDKPLTHGSSRLVDIYFPGVSEQGTPSFGSETYLFYDFGWFGAVVSVLRMENLLTIFSFILLFFFHQSKIFNNKTLFLISLMFVSPEFGAQMPILYRILIIFFLSIFIRFGRKKSTNDENIINRF